jgi:sulfonate transport system substrate-binding protein
MVLQLDNVGTRFKRIPVLAMNSVSREDIRVPRTSHPKNNKETLCMHICRLSSLPLISGLMAVVLAACAPSEEVSNPPTAAVEAALAPISVSGSYWIELSPVLVAANRFYPVQIPVGEGGITRITSGEADLATNAETQLLRESMVNPDLRIIMTVTESFYRLVARRSAGIQTLADLKGKRVMVPRFTSANYYLVAMLRTVGLTEADVTLVNLLPTLDGKSGMDQMSDALERGDVDVIAIWEPEPEEAIHQLGDDAIVLQDRSVYREVFNLHARAPDLADPAKRRAIVTFVRAVIDATAALQTDPERYWPHVSEITGFSVEQIGWGWPEMEFPVHIIPDMLDVLEIEEEWVAMERDRTPRSRAELAQLIDYSVLEEALALP